MEAPVISARNLTVMQGERLILQEVSFDIGPGDFAYLLGTTGSGKTSLMRTLYADLPVSGGELYVAGFPVHNIKAKEIPFLRRRLGIIFQDFSLLTDRSAEENLFFVMRATGWKNQTDMRTRIGEVLELTGLSGTEQKFPLQLSGGEQQRLAIARALVNSPHIILADEPTGNLDPAVAYGILKEFFRIREGGTAILMATHHHNFLHQYPERVLLCENGGVKAITKNKVIQRILG